MNLNRRIEKLENKLMPGNGVYIIDMKEGENTEQAQQRYCVENGITVEDLGDLVPGSMVIFVNKYFPD